MNYIFEKKHYLISLLLWVAGTLCLPQRLEATEDREVNEEEAEWLAQLDTAKGSYRVKVYNHLFIATYYSEPHKAFQYVTEGITLARSLGDKMQLGNCHNNLGMFFLDRGNYPFALEQFLLSRELREQIRDSAGLAGVYTNIGMLYQKQELYAQALEFYHKGLALDYLLGDSVNTGYSLNNIGNAWLFNGKPDSALHYLEKALQYKSSDLYSQPSTLNTLGEVYARKGDWIQAEKYFQEALSLRKETGNVMELPESYLSLAHMEKKRGRIQSAIQYAKEAHALADQSDHFEQMIEAARILSGLYFMSKEFAEAYQWQSRFIQMKDSLFNSEILSRMLGIEASHKIQHQDAEIAFLKGKHALTLAEAKQKQFMLWGSILGIILLSLLLLVLYSRYRTRQKAHRLLKNRSLLIEEKNNLIEYQNKQITDSIRYARNIQESFLPAGFTSEDNCLSYFVINQPRDIVSGDFYWMENSTGRVICVLADGTGHGVPGAFVSLIGIHLIKSCLRLFPEAGPAQLLYCIQESFYQALSIHRGKDEINEGMDIGIVVYIPSEKRILFAGANRPLVSIQDYVASLTKGNNVSIGEKRAEGFEFTQHELKVQPGDRFYLFSDGMTDLLGGPKKRRITTPSVIKWLESLQSMDFAFAATELKNKMQNWQQKTPPPDDTLLIGIQINK